MNDKIKELEINNQIGFIIENDMVYRNSLNEILTSLKGEKLVPFLGAGISFASPSYVPLAGKIIYRIIDLLKLTFDSFANGINLSNDVDIQKLKSLMDETRMERLFDILSQSYGQEALNGLLALDGNKPNFNHKSIAILSENNLLKSCITLNFDILIEKASKDYKTYCPLVSQNPIFQEGNGKLRIIKPHGSFEKEGIKNDRLKYTYATISQAGDMPHPENIDSLEQELKNEDILLVAGYSDNDWDIFPIIRDIINENNNLRIIWIQFETSENVLLKKTNSLNQKGFHKVLNLISSNNKHCILIGDVSNVFNDILKRLRITIEPEGYKDETVISDWSDNIINDYIDFLKSSPDCLLLALSKLLGCQTEFLFQRHFLQNVISSAKSKENYKLLHNAYAQLAGTYHMESKYKRALIFRKHVLVIEKKYPVNHSLNKPENYMLLGYDYLCIAKHPNVSLINVPYLLYNLILGFWYLNKSIKLEHKFNPNSKNVKMISTYYKLDLFHSWLNLLLIFGPKVSWAIRLPYKILYSKYKTLFRKYPPLANVEYYWMRALEAQIISTNSKITNKQDIENQLNKIEDSCKLTYKQIHIGNVYLYRALISGSKEKIETGLSKAERHWNGENENKNDIHSGYGKFYSGLRHVILFKRYLGFISFKKAMKDLRVSTNI